MIIITKSKRNYITKRNKNVVVNKKICIDKLDLGINLTALRVKTTVPDPINYKRLSTLTLAQHSTRNKYIFV